MILKVEIWVTLAIFIMFIRKKRNKNWSVSVQIISKNGLKNKLLKTIGCAKTTREKELLKILANNEL